MANELQTQSGKLKFLNPPDVLRQLEIKAGMKIADFGCGAGFFAIELGRLVAPDGFVYAIDVVTQALESVKSRAEMSDLANIIVPIRANLEVLGSTKLEDNSCDMVWIANVLFQSQKKAEIIAETKRILKTGGQLVLIDWKQESPFHSRETYYLISAGEAQKIVEAGGFRLEKRLDAGQHHFGFLFVK